MILTASLWMALSLVLGCGEKDDTGEGDGGADGGSADGGSDGGTTDGGTTDGGTTDGGTTDGGTTDGGSDGGGDGGATSPDNDGDGFPENVDCDDENEAVNPLAVEVYDAIDNDCDGEIDNIPWGYTDEDGHIPPEEWADYYPDCDGEEQSPIDLTKHIFDPAPPTSVTFDWGEASLDVEHHGHALVWNLLSEEGEAAHSITWEDVVYELQQFHVHVPSEHTAMGVPLVMEMHFVHFAAEAKTVPAKLVTSVLFEVGEEDNAFLSAIGFDRLPASEGVSLIEEGTTFDLLDGLPAAFTDDPTVAVYDGSLTTPPCTEGVRWVLVGAVSEVSADQLAAMEAVIDDNARPTQELYGRRVTITRAVR